MRVLVACEFSGIVREAFKSLGHDAWSCDLLDTERPGQHYKEDVLQIIKKHKFDLMIAHPPCTHLAVSGARWWKNKRKEQMDALDFVQDLMDAPIEKICIENPISIISSKIRKPDQIIHPYQFGDNSTKSTCLWLKGLKKLIATNIIKPTRHITKSGKSYDEWWFKTCLISNLKERSKERSRTFPGVAKAMAEQWGRE